MPRIYHVKKCRKARGLCEYCHKEIEKGQGYKYFAFFRAAERRRHATCPDWKPSQLESQEEKSMAMAAAEDAMELINQAAETADIRTALEETAGTIREASEAMRDKAQSIQEHFPDSEQATDLESWAEELDSWADECESAAGDMNDFDEDECRAEVEDDVTEEYAHELGDFEDSEGDTVNARDDLENHPDFSRTELESRLLSAIEDQQENELTEDKSTAETILGNCPF